MLASFARTSTFEYTLGKYQVPILRNTLIFCLLKEGGGGGGGNQNWAFATTFGRLDPEMKQQELGRLTYISLESSFLKQFQKSLF